MNSKQVGAVVVCALVATIAACSNDIPITPEAAASAASSSGTQGAGAGGGLTSTAASTGAGSGGNSSSSSSSGGAGCCVPGPIQVQGTVKTITADTDMAQYFSGTVQGSNQVLKIVDGPAFIMDLAGGSVSLFTISGTDCAAPLPHVFIHGAANGAAHNLRIPILSGQSLCEEPTGNSLNYTGFKPY